MSAKKIWKFGSRWGNCSPSVLELFLDYGCVFFGGAGDGTNIGNWEEVQEGDYFVVADGLTPVAIGIILSPALKYDELGIKFCQWEENDFDLCNDRVVFFKVKKIWLLSPGDRQEFSVARKRFCRHYQRTDFIEKKISEFWKDEQCENFEIKSRTVKLIGKGTDDAVFSQMIRYRIPIYQRPYSWGENEIRRLFEDLSQACTNAEPVFMGTMQVSAPIPLNPDNSKVVFELIDGQQRITTFYILLTILAKKLNHSFETPGIRTAVNRGTAQQYLNQFVEWQDNKQDDPLSDLNPYTNNGRLILQLLDECFKSEEEKEKLWTFLLEKIRFVLLETHAGLSKTLKIFNTINTAGLDLGASDLFKIRFFEYRKSCGDQDEIFDEISELYGKIDKYNQKHPNCRFSMMDLLATYQRIIYAKHSNAISRDAFYMGTERFFERLFDTLLNVHIHPEFKELPLSADNESYKFILSIKDLEKLYECFVQTYALEERDIENKIHRTMLFETRYAIAWNYTIIARFFTAEENFDAKQKAFDLNLLKMLIVPSLQYGKIVYGWQEKLREFLLKLVQKAVDKNFEFEFVKEKSIVEKICESEIADSPRWKNLLCKLVEYLVSTEKDSALYERLFRTAYDIEHIQCVNDENSEERDNIREIWGEELNRIGNLVLLEQWVNRSIGNRKDKKKEQYASSRYQSIRCLPPDLVDNWDVKDAEDRRAHICDIVYSFLSNTSAGQSIQNKG